MSFRSPDTARFPRPRALAALTPAVFAPLLVLLAALISPPGVRPAAAAVAFDARFMAYPTGSPSFACAVGDFNGDGRPDVVAASPTPAEIVVFLGLAGGALAPGVHYSMFCQPTSVAVGDFNADGRLDLAVANDCGPGEISILLGRGDGTFWPRTDYVVGTFAQQVCVADFDGDGRADVAASGGSGASVLFGNGLGGFGGAVTVSISPYQPLSIAAADFDGDGRTDLAIGVNNNGSSGGISVFRNSGGRAFAKLVDLATGLQPWFITAADLNQDGRPDLVSANRNDLNGIGQGSVTVRLNLGGGAFAARRDFNTGTQPWSIGVADLSADGKPDLAVACKGSGTVDILRGSGDGSFSPGLPVPGGRGPSGVAVTDIDLDGAPDLVVADQTDGMLAGFVNVLRGRPGPLFSGGIQVPTGTNPVGIAIADLDGDHVADLAVANSGDYYMTPGRVSVARGLGDGHFLPATALPTPSVPRDVLVADFNRDGIPDLGVPGSSSFSVYRGLGGMSFAPPVLVSNGVQLGCAVTADFNRDGIPDLALGHSDFFSPSDSVLVLLGRGDGSFAPPLARAVGTFLGAFTTADFDGDGIPDLAVTYVVSGTPNHGWCRLLLGRGDGTWTDGALFSAAVSPGAIAAGDLDGDGRPDLALLDNSLFTFSVYRNLGGGAFSAPATTALGFVPASLALADFNRDGLLDLAVSASYSSVVAVFAAHGGATFEPPLHLGAGANVVVVAAGLVDGDALPDLVSGDSYGTVVDVMLNRTTDLPTAALASLVEAGVVSGAVEITWQLGGESPQPGVERREGTAPWQSLASPGLDGEYRLHLRDTSVQAGRRYDYRLTSAGAEIPGGAVSIDVPVAGGLAFERLSPNPASDRVQARFRLPAGTRARLELWDVAGRRVRAEDVVVDGSGEASATLPVRDLPSGVYTLRLGADALSRTLRVAVVH